MGCFPSERRDQSLLKRSQMVKWKESENLIMKKASEIALSNPRVLQLRKLRTKRFSHLPKVTQS